MRAPAVERYRMTALAECLAKIEYDNIDYKNQPSVFDCRPKHSAKTKPWRLGMRLKFLDWAARKRRSPERSYAVRPRPAALAA